jgi:hypothetical protein
MVAGELVRLGIAETAIELRPSRAATRSDSATTPAGTVEIVAG